MIYSPYIFSAFSDGVHFTLRTCSTSNFKSLQRIRELFGDLYNPLDPDSRWSTRFNQTTVAYDASKEEKVKALDAKKAEVTERLRDKS